MLGPAAPARVEIRPFFLKPFARPSHLKNPMQGWRAVTCVLGLALVLLGYGIGRSGLAAPFSDPVTALRAQDETTYAASAAELATHGGWMTPQILGRYFLVKPPLFIWLAAISMKIFGVSAFALRIPALLAGCLARHGLPRTPADLGLAPDEFTKAALHAPATRPGRYTILERLNLDETAMTERVRDFVALYGAPASRVRS